MTRLQKLQRMQAALALGAFLSALGMAILSAVG